jgi:hypothetical protein
MHEGTRSWQRAEVSLIATQSSVHSAIAPQNFGILCELLHVGPHGFHRLHKCMISSPFYYLLSSTKCSGKKWKERVNAGCYATASPSQVGRESDMIKERYNDGPLRSSE